jgi:hypothetical protein
VQQLEGAGVAHLIASSCGKSSEKKAYFASSTLLANVFLTNALQVQSCHRMRTGFSHSWAM